MKNRKQIAILNTGYESYAYEVELFARYGFDLIIYDGPPKDKNLMYAFASKATGILVRELLIDDKALALMPDLKAIVRYGVGYDNIDVDIARKKNIRVANVQGYGNHSVSDHAMALMFALTRDLEGSRKGAFSKPSRSEVFELHNKTLGIIGLGRIGSQFSRKASPLFQHTIACDPYKSGDYIQSHGARKVDLSELLTESHVISLHCNLTGETRHILNAATFQNMKQKPVVINTSRGPVIHEESLLSALNSGVVHSAGLDVFEQEPPGKEQLPLLDHPHVVHTPHVAWYSDEAIRVLQTRAADNIIGLLTGKPVEDELYA